MLTRVSACESASKVPLDTVFFTDRADDLSGSVSCDRRANLQPALLSEDPANQLRLYRLAGSGLRAWMIDEDDDHIGFA